MPIERLMRLLNSVTNPAQYLGNEVNAVRKDFSAQKLRVALVFPDLYTIGMSHMGLKILYDILNNVEGVVAERCFAPAKDFEALLRRENIPLYGLESKTPLSEFDIIGITLPYELTYTNILNIIELARIPLWQKDRYDNHPLILAGGTGAYNPEPMADFLDAVAIGDGEEIILDIVGRVLEWKSAHGIDRIAENRAPGSRRALLDHLSSIEGMYVPSLFAPSYHTDGTLSAMNPRKPGYTGVKKRVVADLNEQPYPTKTVLPNVRLVHDRIGIEIQRGCTRMCRFCQAGYIERPTRQRSPERVLEIARKSYAQTGIDEISLLSLSAGDYQTIVPTLKALNACFAGKNVAVSVPATRTETLTPELIAEIKKVRMSGFTIAPEAGSERMRRVINKGNKVEDFHQACRNAFSAGYRLLKFYYMCGLPFETDEDVIGIAREAGDALKLGFEYGKNVELNVSVSSFVPKPFTPFQWEPQISIAETRRKHHLVRQNLSSKRLNFKHHSPEMSYLEGLFSRGDRRLSRVIHRAYHNGCRLDEWSEHFDYGLWEKTFVETGVDLAFYLHRERGKNELLPWDHLFTQMQKEWLWNERVAALEEAFVEDCSIAKCADFCGACDFKTVKNKIYVIDEKPLAVKKGNREWYGRFGESNATTPLSRPFVPPSPPKGEGNDAANTSAQRFKLRARFSKTGPAALFGHLELMHQLKRAFLRAEIPAAYSEGFHPQIRLSMGPALPVGLESEAEYFDLLITTAPAPAVMLARLNASLPVGLAMQSLEYIDSSTPAFYSQPLAIRYRLEALDDTVPRWQKLATTFGELANGRDITYARVGKKPGSPPTILPLQQCLKVLPGDGSSAAVVEFITLAEPHGFIKPTEVVAALTGATTAHDLSFLRMRKMGIGFPGKEIGPWLTK